MENYIIANKSDVGQARSVNEDSMITFDSPNGRVVAVCDGMGGQAAGDVASQLACSIIRDILEDNTFASPSEAITRAVIAANQGVLHRAQQEPQLEGMGCTCVMLIIKDGEVHYGWVGDSRIYYISNHTIRQISKDQSYVQSLVDSGQITPEEAANHPQKNEITNAIGIEGMVPPVLCQMPIKPEPGSVFLLCSDGLTGMVDDARIERVVSSMNLTLQEKADRLVELANQAGGLDNITVQLVEFGAVLAEGAAATAMPYAAIPPTTSTKKGRALWYWLSAAVLVVAALAGVYFGFCGGEKSETKEKAPASNVDTRRSNNTTNTQSTPASQPTPSTTTTRQTNYVDNSGSSKPKTRTRQTSNPEKGLQKGTRTQIKNTIKENKKDKEKTTPPAPTISKEDSEQK